MKPDIVLQSDMLDILFENRNKQYGAYALRRGYDRRMVLSLTGMISLVVLFASWNFYNNRNKPNSNSIFLSGKDSVDVIICTIPIEPPQPPPAAAPKAPRVQPATIKFTAPVIVKDPPKEDIIPMPDAIIDDVQIGNKTTDGDRSGTVNGTGEGVTGGTGNAPTQPIPEPVKEPAVLELAEVMPQFPGGTPALIRFLGKHLRVPEGKLESGERMRVPVKFIVSKEGKLIDIQFTENADEEYKSEIRRVLKKMPDWIPGSQHGKPVPVYFSIPVVFEVTDM
ncbi:energy transducer TonB [Pseudoflavitalea sp. G-6-1-2]|uniref:energy transducer TonB family protein n=1 Tax=Pseudoflavitalea sp. G-6-1-2 TaxID=2728841 RepID=UPI00146BFB58|nr:energy transducer TonB [Pseudoflavitalea sp. G-6-1-2]NML19296.1 energy transducer TonB [Pseudoflavitalea sp. G-6-1-2]